MSTEKCFEEMTAKELDEFGVFGADDFGPCFVCGKRTKFVDYSYEDWFCSAECQETIDKKWSLSLAETILSNDNEAFV